MLNFKIDKDFYGYFIWAYKCEYNSDYIIRNRFNKADLAYFYDIEHDIVNQMIIPYNSLINSDSLLIYFQEFNNAQKFLDEVLIPHEIIKRLSEVKNEKFFY